MKYTPMQQATAPATNQRSSDLRPSYHMVADDDREDWMM